MANIKFFYDNLIKIYTLPRLHSMRISPLRIYSTEILTRHGILSMARDQDGETLR